MSATTVIIGGGVVGLSLAHALSREGREVTLIEREPQGFNASCGNAGGFGVTEVMPLEMIGVLRKLPGWLLDPLGPVRIGPAHMFRMLPWMLGMSRVSRPQERARIAGALAALLSRAREDSLPLLEELGLSGELHQRGALWVYETMAAFRKDAADRAARRALGVKMQEISGAEARRLEPALGPRTIAAIMTPQWMHLDDPAQVVRKLRERLGQSGVTTSVGDALAIDGRDIVLVDGRRIPFDGQVVIAAGAWSGRLSASISDRALLDSERGYNRTIANPGIELGREIIFAERHFVATPMSMGLRIGGAAEFRGLDGAPDYRRSAALAELAKIYFPDLSNTQGTDWMGHRPATPDSLPVIGVSPRRADVFYAFGHGHVGLTLAATTARLLTDQMMGRTPAVDLAPYSIARFAR